VRPYTALYTCVGSISGRDSRVCARQRARVTPTLPAPHVRRAGDSRARAAAKGTSSAARARLARARESGARRDGMAARACLAWRRRRDAEVEEASDGARIFTCVGLM